MRVRVVWGLWVTMASFWPRRALSRVDLPALGRPMMETKPERSAIRSVSPTGDGAYAGGEIVRWLWEPARMVVRYTAAHET